MNKLFAIVVGFGFGFSDRRRDDYRGDDAIFGFGYRLQHVGMLTTGATSRCRQCSDKRPWRGGTALYRSENDRGPAFPARGLFARCHLVLLGR